MSKTNPENNLRHLEALSLYQQALEIGDSPDSIARGSHWAIASTLAGSISLEQLQESVIYPHGETPMRLSHPSLRESAVVTLGSLGLSLGAESSPAAFTLPTSDGENIRLELLANGQPNYQIEAL